MKYGMSIVGVLIAGVVLSACNNRAPETMSASPATQTMQDAATQTQQTANDAVNAVGDAAEQVTDQLPSQSFDIAAQNNSGQSGEVVISATADGKTKVSVGLTGGSFTAPQPAHIHLGTCPKPGAIKYPLNNVVNGASETILDVPMDTFLGSAEDLALNVHKSAAEMTAYTACVDLN